MFESFIRKCFSYIITASNGAISAHFGLFYRDNNDVLHLRHKDSNKCVLKIVLARIATKIQNIVFKRKKKRSFLAP
jgi:hypothetical protein